MQLFESIAYGEQQASSSLGGMWNEIELAMYSPLERKDGEGSGERSYRYRSGLSTGTLGITSSVDVPELMHEVKCVQDRTGTFNGKIRLGTKGNDFWARNRQVLLQETSQEEDQTILNSAEISQKKIDELSADIRGWLLESMVSTDAMSGYEAIVLVARPGFVVVPKEHFAIAFEFKGISQSSPHYRLRRDYMRLRLPTLIADPQ